jgi:arabinofuranosyltransferase
LISARLRKPSSVLSQPFAYLLPACLILFAHQVFYYRALGSDAIDDAYISFRYAQNLVAGQGLVFNAGERVEGYTNFLWTIMLALSMRLGFEPSLVAIGLGALFGLATLWLGHRFLRLTPLRRSPVPIIAVYCLALDGSFALWAVSGMETSMFAFLLLAGVTAYLWEWQNEKPGFLSGIVLALATMTRPEGALVFAVVVIHQAVARLALQRRLLTSADVARTGIFLGLYLPYFLWRYYYYGFLLPNTFYAKVTVTESEAQHQRGLRYLRTFLSVHLGWLLPLLALVPLVKRKFSFWITSLLILVLVYAAYIVYVGGDWSVGRFFVPILPPAYILLATGLVEAYRTVQGWVARITQSFRVLLALRCVALSVLAAALVGLFGFSSLKGEHELFIVRFQAARATHARVALGKWLHDNVPRDTFIAVDAAGQVPYYSGLRTLDMFGVNDVHTAHLKVETMGQGVPGHEKFDFDYIMWRRPDLIIAAAPFLDGSDTYGRLDVTWTDNPSLRDFLYIYRRKGWAGGERL